MPLYTSAYQISGSLRAMCHIILAVAHIKVVTVTFLNARLAYLIVAYTMLQHELVIRFPHHTVNSLFVTY